LLQSTRVSSSTNWHPIPIQTWNYKSEPETVRHLGVMAQDFRAAFNLGKDDKTLNTVDAQGVTMAATQALYQISLEQRAKIEAQQAQLKRQKQELDALKKLVCQSNPQAEVVQGKERKMKKHPSSGSGVRRSVTGKLLSR
jgi:hypothetical protein